MINIQRAVSQTEVEAGQLSVSVAQKQTLITAKVPSDQPRILYQCGDCDELFKSLDLWQAHRKEGTCHQDASGSHAVLESQTEPETPSLQSTASPLNVDGSNRLAGQQPEEEEQEEEEGERQEVGETAFSQSSDPPVAAAATSPSYPDESSPRKRGANKKPKPEPVLLCVDCGSCFGLVSELVAHRKTQHGFEEALHRCSVCGESFLNTTLFLYHRKQHRQKGEENVVVISEFTSEEDHTQSNGTEHVSTASTTTVTSTFTWPELFMCTQCGQSFTDEGGLVTHREQKHGLKKPLHTCSQCDRSFMNTTQYLYHRRQHSLTSATEVADGAETNDEAATTKPQDSPQSSKRLLSPSASASESDSPLSKKSKPSFRIVSGNMIKGEWISLLEANDISYRMFLPELIFLLSGNKGSGGKDDLEGSATADSDNTNHPPPAKLLQDWARTPLPHVCPHCGKTFTRRVFLRTHVYSHTGEKLFTCKVPVRILITMSAFLHFRKMICFHVKIYVVQLALMR